MATYTPTSPIDLGGNDNAPNYGARLRRARLGLICGVATVTMVFVSLTSAYIVRQGLPTYDEASSSYVHDWGGTDLPWRLLGINTILLLASSVTMELARRSLARKAEQGRENKFPWLGATAILGVGFLIGQGMAWRELHLRGFFVNTNPSSSFVFLLTATHAVHLAGGIIALLWASTTALLHRPVESRRIVVDITAWYWHFMAALWIYVFALLGFAR